MTETADATVVESFDLFPNPRGLAKQMLEIWCDPVQVRFRAELRKQPENIAWLNQAIKKYDLHWSGELPEIEDPVRTVYEFPVRVLSKTHFDMAEVIQNRLMGISTVFDVEVGEVVEVPVLNGKYYREGDHFTNPLEGDPR